MYRVQLTRTIIALVVLLAGMVGAASYFSVPINDPKLTSSGLDGIYDGKPFTGIAYELYSQFKPYRLIMFWFGKRAGYEIHWYPSGRLWTIRPFQNGTPNGESRTWYETGRVQKFETFAHGETQELWSWHPNGQLAEYASFQQGQETARKSWTFDGKPFYNYVYQEGIPVGVRGGDFCKRIKVTNFP